MNEPTVRVLQGEHSNARTTPFGTEHLIVQALIEHGLSGEYDVTMGPSVFASPHTPKFAVKKLTTSGIELYVKPGNNQSAHTCYLRGGELTLQSVYDKLMQKPRKPRPIPFSNDPENIKRLCLVVNGFGDKDIPVEELRTELSSILGTRSGHAWGRVLASLANHDYLKTEVDSGGRIKTVRLSKKGRALCPLAATNGHASTPHSSSNVEELSNVEMSDNTAAEAAPGAAPRAALSTWLTELARQEEQYLEVVIQAEADVKKAETSLLSLRELLEAARVQLNKASRAAQAARVLLEE